MTTKQTEWKEYTGSDEQIAEMSQAKSGYLLRLKNGNEPHLSRKYSGDLDSLLSDTTHYLICNPHPLADMIIRQAQTGQPVWVKYKNGCLGGDLQVITTTPDWNIPNAEYRFTPFED